jgi:hypothetical protein
MVVNCDLIKYSKRRMILGHRLRKSGNQSQHPVWGGLFHNMWCFNRNGMLCDVETNYLQGRENVKYVRMALHLVWLVHEESYRSYIRLTLGNHREVPP